MIRTHHWIGAVLLAALAHIAVFALLAFNPPKGTAAAQGEMGIEIDLGMLGDLGQAQETQQPKEVAPPKPTPPPPPPEPTPEPPRQQAQARVQAKPKPRPEPPREQVEAPQPAPEPAPAAPAVETGQSDANQAQLKQSTGVGNAATAGGMGGASTDYKAKIAASLARHKHYPRASRRRREEGEVILSFVIHRDGTVTDARVSKSSGVTRLDQAALKTLENASPFPPFSDDMTETQMSVRAPIDFTVVNRR
ncbi:energy transducer TonB [Halopseudomonas sp.]|uniref:energy transducer TonB n=1 Tax=Halopseudomonas sp. TaxID=2901191 RepID=UPI00311D9150